MRLGAEFDSTKKYRYSLWRIWREDSPVLTWLMLNPSTADESQDDPTIRRCIGYSMNMAYGGCVILNIFAYRSTDPAKLLTVEDPVGRDNDRAILRVVSTGLVICGWGKVHKELRWRTAQIRFMLRDCNLQCLKENSDGSPAHPLYLSSQLRPRRWNNHVRRD